MSSIVTTITSSSLTVTAAEIHVEHEAAQRRASEAVAHAIRCGELLIEAKASLPHGAFGAWLAANVEFSDRTARGYMRLAGMDEAKRRRVADMSLRGALRSLSSPRFADTTADITIRRKLDLLQEAHEHMQAILADAPPSPELLPHARATARECNDMLLDIGALGPQHVSLVVVELLCTLSAIERRDGIAHAREVQ